MTAIELSHLCKQFKLGESMLTAIEDVEFQVQEREFVSLIGPSGCGKSTVLRLISGLIPATKGSILVHGLSPEEARRKRMFAFVFQDPVLFPWRSVIRNVELPLEIGRTTSRKLHGSKARELLDLVGLSGFADARPAQLSGGMKQRAAIARALLLGPSVLLMDEPFGALDEISRDRMNIELLRIWNATGAAVLFVTHSIEEAVFLSDRIVILSPRPARVIKEIKIDLPRPRTPDIKQSEELFSYNTLVRKHLTMAIAAASQSYDDQ